MARPPIQPEEVAFEKDVFLLTKAAAQAQRAKPELGAAPPAVEPPAQPVPEVPEASKTILRVAGTIPPEIWNRLGTKVLPKLRQGEALTVAVDCSVRVEGRIAPSVVAEIKQALADLELDRDVEVVASQESI